MSRRAVLLGGAAAVVLAVGAGAGLVEVGVIRGRARLNHLIGLDGADPEFPDTAAGPMVRGSFASAHRGGRETAWAVSYPPGHRGIEPLPVMVALHGRGGTHRSAFEDLGLDRFLAQAVAAGSAPFAVASVDGGDTYWHARKDGTDSGAMVTAELLPRLTACGLDTRRIAFFGWSMGGYGSLLLASGLPAAQVAAVAVSSPALWTSPGETAAGAFDDAADFQSHDVFARRDLLGRVPLHIDCGDDDPFRDATRSFVEGLPHRPEGGFTPGAHDSAFWRRTAPSQLAFVGRQLAAPG